MLKLNVSVTVSEYMPGGELLGLWQQYGALPEPLVQVYIAEIALAIGKCIGKSGLAIAYSYISTLLG
jgi:serine/threonine protein kinase